MNKVVVLNTSSGADLSLVKTGYTCPVARSVKRSQYLCPLEDLMVLEKASNAN